MKEKENPEYHNHLRRCNVEGDELNRLAETLRLLNSDGFYMCGLSTEAFEDVVSQFSEKITKHLTSSLIDIYKAFHALDPDETNVDWKVYLLDCHMTSLQEHAQNAFDELVKTAIAKAPESRHLRFYANNIRREDEMRRQEQAKSGKEVAK